MEINLSAEDLLFLTDTAEETGFTPEDLALYAIRRYLRELHGRG